VRLGGPRSVRSCRVKVHNQDGWPPSPRGDQFEPFDQGSKGAQAWRYKIPKFDNRHRVESPKGALAKGIFMVGVDYVPEQLHHLLRLPRCKIQVGRSIINKFVTPKDNAEKGVARLDLVVVSNSTFSAFYTEC
jgi:hypothetical protein